MGTSALKILLVEDNTTIAAQVGEFLAGHGWDTDFAYTAKQGICLADDNIYDVILLDLNLPDGDGLRVCETIKGNAQVVPPILMVTARDGFEAKAAGYERGADDYLTKPYDLRELVLRCRALAKRHWLHTPKVLQLGELRLDTRARQVHRKGQPLTLTGVGYRILEILMRAHPRPVSRAQLSHQLWGDNPPETDALKSHIYVLRKAMDRPFSNPLLKTVLNVGFRLDLHGDDDQQH